MENSSNEKTALEEIFSNHEHVEPANARFDWEDDGPSGREVF